MKENTLKLLRIYIPFIFTLTALINTIIVLFIIQEPSFTMIMSEVFGGSIFVDIYMFIVSRNMCFYYKANIFCLFLTHVTNIMYDYFLINDTIYLTTIIILLMFGVIFFIIFKRKYIVKIN